MKTVNHRKCATCRHHPSAHTKDGCVGPAPAECTCAARCKVFVPVGGKKKSNDHVTEFEGKIRLGKREAFLHVTCTLTVPENLTPREKKALERFDLAAALSTMRAVPSGRLDAILASVQAKLDVVSVADYLKAGDEAPPPKLTKPQRDELRRLYGHWQDTYGTSRTRVQNALVKMDLARFFDDNDSCRITDRGRAVAVALKIVTR